MTRSLIEMTLNTLLALVSQMWLLGYERYCFIHLSLKCLHRFFTRGAAKLSSIFSALYKVFCFFFHLKSLRNCHLPHKLELTRKKRERFTVYLWCISIPSQKTWVPFVCYFIINFREWICARFSHGLKTGYIGCNYFSQLHKRDWVCKTEVYRQVIHVYQNVLHAKCFVACDKAWFVA